MVKLHKFLLDNYNKNGFTKELRQLLWKVCMLNTRKCIISGHLTSTRLISLSKWYIICNFSVSNHARRTAYCCSLFLCLCRCLQQVAKLFLSNQRNVWWLKISLILRTSFMFFLRFWKKLLDFSAKMFCIFHLRLFFRKTMDMSRELYWDGSYRMQ